MTTSSPRAIALAKYLAEVEALRRLNGGTGLFDWALRELELSSTRYEIDPAEVEWEMQRTIEELRERLGEGAAA